MKKVIKKSGKTVKAYRLGTDNGAIKRLMEEGKIKKLQDNVFEIFSQESVNGKGEIAYLGDYIKIDSSGEPYPNKGEFFRKNHRHLRGDDYEQLPKVLKAWMIGEDDCEELEFLKKHKGLSINSQNPQKYFSAPLWGSILSANKDAVIVFYHIEREKDGKIVDIDFNFVERTEFDQAYHILK